jgi:glutamine cyclotransferase
MGRNNTITTVLLTLSIILAVVGGCAKAGPISEPPATLNTPTVSPTPSEVSQSATPSVQTINSADAFKLIQENKGNADFIILDVRTPDEFNGGHIGNAVNIDFYSPDFKSNLEKLDRNKLYLVYCLTGGRSASASQMLSELGFPRVYNLAGGITRWIQDGYPTTSSLTVAAPVYAYKIINVYPHDSAAFTEGLAYDGGFLYEGTGLNGSSSLRQEELSTGKILHIYNLPKEYFGEGITIFQNKIFQLTWKSQLGFVYNKDTLSLLRNFSYSTEGWGLTQDGARLIMSDGTASLHFLDFMTLQTTGSLTVQDGDTSIERINELEYVKGQIYANIWRTDKIAIIEPRDGRVSGWIDLAGLLQTQNYNGQADVLNGIAYDQMGDRLFVTGKYWPFLFEIQLVTEKKV